jgi:hypothetical protein
MSVYRVGTNKSSTNVFPSIRPTLDLDFANTKTLDPRITFTRASGGSYVGADGLIKYAGVNEARFDHDPETGESLGLLIEEARTNLLLWSEDFRNTAEAGESRPWLRFRISLAPNAAIAPDGTLTAYKLIEDTTANITHVIAQGVTVFANPTTFVQSFFAKAAERQYISVGAAADAKGRVFDLYNGTTFGTNSGVSGWAGLPDNLCSITPVGNGWYRISTTHTTTTNAGNSLFDRANLFLHNGNTTIYTGDGTSGIYIWGAQLEAGAFPTSYIPTQASTRTRATDTTRILGDNFKAFYNPNEFTMQCIFSRFSNNSPPYALAISSSELTNTSLPSIRIRTDNNRSVQGQAVSSNNIVVYNNTVNTFLNINQVCNSAIAVKSGSTIYSDSGKLAPESNILGLFDGATTMHISSGGARINGHIRLVRYFSKRLPNQQLRALTR